MSDRTRELEDGLERDLVDAATGEPLPPGPDPCAIMAADDERRGRPPG